jgi:hypothetical protein
MSSRREFITLLGGAAAASGNRATADRVIALSPAYPMGETTCGIKFFRLQPLAACCSGRPWCALHKARRRIARQGNVCRIRARFRVSREPPAMLPANACRIREAKLVSRALQATLQASRTRPTGNPVRAAVLVRPAELSCPGPSDSGQPSPAHRCLGTHQQPLPWSENLGRRPNAAGGSRLNFGQPAERRGLSFIGLPFLALDRSALSRDGLRSL